MPETPWYVGINREQKGPFPESGVVEMILRRELLARHFVWREGMEEWVRVADVEVFADALRDAPPPPSRALPGAAFVRMLFSHLWAIVRDPGGGLNAVVQARPLSFAAFWILGGTAVFALLSWRGLLAPFVQVKGESGLAILGKSLLHGLLLYGFWFGALIVFFGPILRSRAGWRESVVVLGIATVPMSLLGLAAFALLWIPGSSFHAFVLTTAAVAAAPAAALLLFRGIIAATGCSPRAGVYAVPLICVAANCAYALLRLAMG